MLTMSGRTIIEIEEPDLSHPREPVESSSISFVGWDDESLDLWITFKESDLSYRYFQVPEFEYDNLMNAQSIGRYFSKQIKPFYECEDEV